MQKRLLSLLYYSIFWLLFFYFGRIFFILFQHKVSFHNSFTGLLGTFLHGSKLDISTAGYYLLIPVLLVIPSVFFNGSWYRHLVRWYTYFMIIITSVIIVSDANLYSYWGFRMDYTPLFYLRTPEEAMASVSTLRIILFFASIIIIAAIFIFIFNRYIERTFRNFPDVRYPLPSVLMLLVIWGALIIPIRGGFSIAPINAGSVYFSKDLFLNHTAVNAVWNVGTTAFTGKPVKNPYMFVDDGPANAIVDSLTYRSGPSLRILDNDRPNILLIALESFSGFLIGPLGGDSLVTPNFNRLSDEGILFSNFYASGNRTDKAMPAILNGYPAQPAESIIKEPKKSQSLPGMVAILNDQNYLGAFWYGGEIDFANFNSFVIGSGFDEIITKEDFDPEDYNSKWGVHDHVFFEALRESMMDPVEPFFKVILTLSSHEPFDVPMEPVFNGNDNLSRYRNSVYYTDRYLGYFIDWAKEQDWWENTLVILVADHCCRISVDIPVYSREIFKIPMLWLGGALSQKGIRIEKHGSQVDIPVTLLEQMGIPNDFPFGKDLLSDQSESFAFYTYNEGFGFINDSSAAIYDHKLRGPVVMEGVDPEKAEICGKAYLQVLFDDYLSR